MSWREPLSVYGRVWLSFQKSVIEIDLEMNFDMDEKYMIIPCF